MKLPKPWFRSAKKAWFVEVSGKQVCLGKTKKEADARLAELLLSGGFGARGSSGTMRHLVDDYLEWGWANLAPSTMETRELLLKSFRSHAAAQLRAADLKPHHVGSWLLKSGKRAVNTTNSRQTLIIGVCNWAVKMGLLQASPLARMPVARQEVRQNFVPAEMIPKILAAAQSEEARDLITFLVDTGARATEAFNASVDHYDAENSRLIWPIVDSKGKRRSRVIYLPAIAKEIVERLSANRAPGARLLCGPHGNPWNKDSCRQMLTQIGREVGLAPLRATMFRHSFAHNRLVQGQEVALVSKLMGHTSTHMVYQRYGHLESGNILRDAAVAVPSLVSGGGATPPPTFGPAIQATQDSKSVRLQV